MFSYSCPFCQQRLLAPPERAGQKTICPKCLRPVTIPNPEAEPLGGPEVGASPPAVTELHASESILDQLSSEESARPVDLDDWPTEPIAVESTTVTPLPVTPPSSVPSGPPPAPPRRGSVPSQPRNPVSVPPVQAAAKPETPQAETPASRPRPQPASLPSPGLAPTRTPSPPTPARPAPLVTRRAEPSHSQHGIVVLNPTGMASVDLAAELTAALTMRMKPPQEPPSDLRLSTAVAVIATMIGISLWTVGVVFEPEPLPFVALLGALILAVGWVWAIHLASLQGWMNALIALLPPITVWYLVRPSSDHGARPLLYVICGAMLLGLFAVAQPARSRFQALMTQLDPVHPVVPSKPPAPAERIKLLVERRNPGTLHDHLEALASQDPRFSGSDALSPEERSELAEQLRGLLKSGPGSYDAALRSAALATLARWCPTEGRVEVLKSLTATEPTLRRTALQEAHRWPDEEMARAIASRLNDDRESISAQLALKAIGPPAEPALIGLLKSNDQYFQLTIIGLLEKLGGEPSAKALEQLSQAGPLTEVRREANRVAQQIRKSLTEK